jgi:hypothetical protein
VRLSGRGISIDLPDGWDGIILGRAGDLATMHAANFALPADDGEFASLAIAALPASGVLLVLTEYDQALGGHGLFSAEGLPVPVPDRAFRARAFTQLRPGRYGAQRFCTVSARPFCLYVVVGTDPDPGALVRRANAVLSSVVVEPKDHPGR